ncbi:MAG: hypothetical protein MMC23_001563 [Stictis urceolatum]|nr:hypothetical protein [Stictis urceolata]
MTASDQPSSPKRSKKEDNEDHNTAPEYRANSESPPPPPQRPEKYDPDAISHSVKSENISDEWKHQAPYKIQEEGSFSPKYEASCHCGKVQFQLSREKPLDAKYCHCLTCQRLHGAPFQWAAIFHKTDLNFTHGHHDLVWYDPGSKSTRHQLPCKISCSHCRTPLMDEGRNMILMYPTLIKWAEGKKGEEDRKKFDASCHMFYNRRVIDVKDGKPKWTGLNESSELIDE